MPTTRLWEIQNTMFRTPVPFFSDFLRAQNMVWVIEGKIIQKWSERKQNYFELGGGSSSRGFELPARVRLEKKYEGNPGEIDFGSS